MEKNGKIIKLPVRKPGENQHRTKGPAQVIALYYRFSQKEWIGPDDPEWTGTYTPLPPYNAKPVDEV
ncbi:MAG: hypothetical protein JRH18_19995 [Deltaproteobacteria bacterium]|nr:hypothetical protein [Deltaproteobacteria bacterium]MBW2153934.1 hypothetical protein [Deltaproteobacteria bacterium]